MSRKEEFERTWAPRVGKDAADALWFFQVVGPSGRVGIIVCSVIAAVAMGEGGIGHIIGWIFLAIAVLWFAAWIAWAVRIRLALGREFGLTLWTVPKSPTRFDKWAAANHLKSADERAGDVRAESASANATKRLSEQ